MTRKIALFGAAGAIGQSIASTLRQVGEPYRVVGRDVPGLQALYGSDPLADIRGWNPDSPASIAAAADGIDTLIYLVGVPYWRFDLHPEIMRKTVEGAVQAGARHLFLIGTVYPYGMPLTQPIREDHPRQPHTFKGRMRKAQEDIAMQAHAEGRIQVTVLRLPDFYGPGVTASLLHGAAVAAVQGGTADLIGPIDRPHEFVFVPDVGPVVLKMIDTPRTIGRMWHLGGAGVTTQHAMVNEMMRRTGRTLKTRVVGKTMLRVLGLFKPMLRELVEMHYLQTTPVVMDDAALQEVIGPIAKTSYADGIRQTLDAVSH
jgi:nucleoside-diphosphate-sugar epimerase